MAYSACSFLDQDAGKTLYDIVFSGPDHAYLDKSHVFLYRDGIEQENGFTFNTFTNVTLDDETTEGENIMFRRITPKELPLVDFELDAVLTDTDLDVATLQSLYINHEVLDGFFSVTAAGYLDMDNKKIINVAAGTEDTDGVNLGQISASQDAAAASAAAAATSEGNAATSETNAGVSAVAAALAKTNAETAETNAETAETNAETAQTAAEAAQTAAETAETNAQTAETNAETAETNAETAQTASEEAQAAAEAAEDSVQIVANFRGPWSTATGAFTVPSSFLHNGGYWQLLQDISDITTKEPGVDADYFSLITSELQWERPAGNFSAEHGKHYKVQAGAEITLPASPDDNTLLHFVDLGDMLTTPALLKRNGKLIMGVAEDSDWDFNSGFYLLYDSTNGDWRAF